MRKMNTWNSVEFVKKVENYCVAILVQALTIWDVASLLWKKSRMTHGLVLDVLVNLFQEKLKKFSLGDGKKTIVLRTPKLQVLNLEQTPKNSLNVKVSSGFADVKQLSTILFSNSNTLRYYIIIFSRVTFNMENHKPTTSYQNFSIF